MLTVHGLRKRFGSVAAVEDVSFRLEAGEMLALIGPNGAGKSTCFNMLNGQLRPDAGTVRLHGADITGASPAAMFRRRVGRTFQITATFATMTARQNVQVALRSAAGATWRLAAPDDAARADALLERVGMGAQVDRAAGVLAYGDLKRLELAVALANDPVLLLMDEPTAGMAPAERGALMALVRALCHGSRIGVLFTEHDMDVVFGVADRVLVLSEGRLITEGTPAAIRADDNVRRVYLGE
jgi:branched-chain amino acid transport system ATP-binding protein